MLRIHLQRTGSSCQSFNHPHVLIQRINYHQSSQVDVWDSCGVYLLCFVSFQNKQYLFPNTAWNYCLITKMDCVHCTVWPEYFTIIQFSPSLEGIMKFKVKLKTKLSNLNFVSSTSLVYFDKKCSGMEVGRVLKAVLQ